MFRHSDTLCFITIAPYDYNTYIYVYSNLVYFEMNLYIFLRVAIFLQNLCLELVKFILGKDSPLVRLEWFIIC